MELERELQGAETTERCLPKKAECKSDLINIYGSAVFKIDFNFVIKFRVSKTASENFFAQYPRFPSLSYTTLHKLFFVLGLKELLNA